VKEPLAPRGALLKAAKELRAAQRMYMANRGNESLGKIVAEKAAALDVEIEKSETFPSETGPSKTELLECLQFWRHYSSLNEGAQDDIADEKGAWLDKMEDWWT
jgi:hypothetical protein